MKRSDLSGRYTPSVMRALLDKTFSAVGKRFTKYGGVFIPYFYTYEEHDCIIFPPVSDLEGSTNLTSISTALLKSAPLLKDTSYLEKKMIFPVVEEQGYLFRFFPRNHFVTLHYDPNTQTATLIDSRPIQNSFLYSLTPMKESLRVGLQSLGLDLQHFNVKYQSVQHDDTFCGAWTAINIEALASGRSIEDHMLALSADDKQGIIRHNQDKLFANKLGIYQANSGLNPVDSTPSLSSQGSTSAESLSELVDDDVSDDGCAWDEDDLDLNGQLPLNERKPHDVELVDQQAPVQNIEPEGDLCEDNSDIHRAVIPSRLPVNSRQLTIHFDNMDGLDQRIVLNLEVLRAHPNNASLMLKRLISHLNVQHASNVTFELSGIQQPLVRIDNSTSEARSPAIRLRDLDSVDNSSSDGLSAADSPRDPNILLNAQQDYTERARSLSLGEVAGRRDLNGQDAIVALLQIENHLQAPLEIEITPHFLMQVMCSDAMKAAGIVLLVIGFITLCLLAATFAMPAAAACITALGLSETAMMAIGAASSVVGASILSVGFFMSSSQKKINELDDNGAGLVACGATV